MLHLRTLGGLALQRDGKTLDPVNAQRKALALLAVLATAGETGIGREKLMALLWPERDTERARGALKQMLHGLRRQLGASEAVAGTAELRLDASYVQSDVGGFRHALAAGDLEAAVSYYQGPFLDGVHLDGVPEFQAWVDWQRAELESGYLQALERLARGAEATGDWGRAATWWRRLQAADPLSGRVALSLMQALESSGDRAAALQHARLHESLLREEWGITPDPAVAALADRLRSCGAPPVPQREPRASPIVQPPTPGPGEGAPVIDHVARPSETGDEGHTGSRPSWLRERALRVLVALIVIAGMFSGAMISRADPEAPAPSPAAPARTAVAVLPFANLSAEGEHAYLAAALHSELLTQLSQVAALTVISRTSVMAYEGTGTPLKQIAGELGVGSVLEGSVQVLNGRLRVNVQLIDAATDAHLWANRYDRPLEDAFAIQSDIAQQIAMAVGATLSGAEQRRLAGAPTANTEAYQLYLHAQHYLESSGEPMQRHQIAQQLLERALSLDPEFALAYVELSVIHGRMYFARYDPDPVRVARQREAAETALRLAPELPQAHFAMGLAHYWGRRDYRSALEWFARALGGLPNDERLWAFVGLVHRRLGNWEEASTAFAQSARLDPRGRIEADGVGNTFNLRRLYAEAVLAYNRTLDMNPDAHTVAVWKAMAYIAWEGQLDTMRAAVSGLPADRHLGGAGTRATQHLRLLLLERQADSILYVLRTTRDSTFEAQNSLVPAALYAAWAHRLRRDHQAALAAFDSAHEVLDSLVEQRPEDPRVRAARGFALAGLGRREEALREAEWLQRSEIYRHDAFEGPIWAEQRARILAQAGEVGAALDEIERLLSRPSWVTVHTLRLDPLLDPLRGHPRFQALLATPTPPEGGG